MITDTKKKEDLSRCVCLFLAEMLRTRKVSLDRAADIAAVTIMRFDKITNEVEFLEAIRQLEFEFQELKHLEQDVMFYTQVSERERMEASVREYVIRKLPQSPAVVVEIMQVALKPEVTLETLLKAFPDFALFLKEN